MSWNGYETNNLLRNEGCGEDGTPRFVDVAMALGADAGGDARGIAVADFDNDGDLDIAINHNPGDNDHPERARAKLLRNDVGDRRSWLAVELVGDGANRDAIGALVTIEVAGERQVRQITAGSSYAAQHTQRLYFGLGDHPRVDVVSVRWPDGRSDEIRDVAARQLVRVEVGGQAELLALPGAPSGGAATPPRTEGRAAAAGAVPAG